MRIAFVSLMGGAPWGGSEALWHSAALYALKERDDIFVSVYDWGNNHPKIKQLQDAGATISLRKRYNPFAGYAEKISRFLKHRLPSYNKDYVSIIEFKPSIVFISQGDSFDLAIHHKQLYYLLQKNNIPYSFICHSHLQYGYIPTKAIYPEAIEVFKNALHVFFVSIRQWKLTERRLITKLTNATITWNPINFKFSKDPMLWPKENAVQLAMVGNLDDMKGHDTLLEVLSTVEWRNREWHLNIYGNGNGNYYLKALCDFYKISQNITFHGHVDQIEKVWLINHLLLIPSAGEGLPISLVEAMACARPAVVTDVGGNSELIDENINGFIAASPTVEAFSIALEKAWINKSNWQVMGKKAFEKITSIIDTQPEIKIYEYLSKRI